MYPRINEMLKELHDRSISSFMVTNAQFPERIAQLDPVTQLYVSVDASTRDSLKAIGTQSVGVLVGGNRICALCVCVLPVKLRFFFLQRVKI